MITYSQQVPTTVTNNRDHAVKEKWKIRVIYLLRFFNMTTLYIRSPLLI